MSDPAKPEAAPGADPSMEDILASIRRILSEDEAAPAPPAAEDVLVLEPSMMRSDLPPAPAEPAADEKPAAAAAAQAPEAAREEEPTPPPGSGLVAPETAAAAAASVAGLVRTLASDRALQVRAGGPTIEDLVRQMLRPLLKEWLDANLPALVERQVRAEIERVVGRAIS
ncbi:MAG: DUF2497 domain-containing protein [Acetobacteraceae bacterium]